MVAAGMATEHITPIMTIIMRHQHSPMSKDTGPACPRMDTVIHFLLDTAAGLLIRNTMRHKSPRITQTITTVDPLTLTTVGILDIISLAITKSCGNAPFVTN